MQNMLTFISWMDKPPITFYGNAFLSVGWWHFFNVGDTLLVGTKQGHLLVYTVRAGRGETKFEVSLERSNKSFSKKPIIQVSDKEG